MGGTIFKLKDVHYSYLGRFPALSGITMDITRGARVVFMGANGTGKSTLLAMLDGLIFPDEGSVTVFDKEMCEEAFRDEVFSRNFRRKVGFVFQNADAQLFSPTVKEDILFGPAQLGMEPGRVYEHIHALAARLNIERLLNRSPHQLSIGEKKKVALATTLIMDPEVVILDEPTAGLDPATTCVILEILDDLNSAGATIITATHDVHLVGEIADTVHIFDMHHHVVRSGTPDEILSDEEFLRGHNLIHAHRHKHDHLMHAHPHLHIHHHPHSPLTDQNIE